jgi:hypothetical protein
MSYVFDLDRLNRLADDTDGHFAAAHPYPYMVIDDFLRPGCARQLADEFPGPDAPAWDHYAASGPEAELGSSREECFPEPHRRAIHELNSGVFIRFLERASGIDHLLPDPHLAGGGLHLMRREGLPGIHADFNWHAKLRAHRRLNLLVYLTPGWRPEWVASSNCGIRRQARVK